MSSSPIRQIALSILAISFAVFISFFGSLPIFRRTPIGFLHRLVWIYIPNGLARVDGAVTGGRVGRRLRRWGVWLVHERHPVVLIFFLALLLVSELVFLTLSLPLLPTTFSSSSLYIHYTLIPLLTLPPYLFLYLSASTSSAITPQNHRASMRAYPYDHTIFHGPNHFPYTPSSSTTTPTQTPVTPPTCHTCTLTKPARSKHCPLCSTCIQKHDHHCVWINNCVGRNNYLYFLALMFSISILLAYGSYLGFRVLSSQLQPNPSPNQPGNRGGLRTWADWVARAITLQPLLTAPMLLALVSFPLAAGLTVHHVYLIWVGMTTNESGKWADLREDIAGAVVWRARVGELVGDFPGLEGRCWGESESEGEEGDRGGIVWVGKDWPLKPSWVVVRMEERGRRPRVRRRKVRRTGVEESGDLLGKADREADGQLRRFGEPEGNSSSNARANGQAGESQWEEDERWTQVKSLGEIENVYDLGFWDNLKDVMWNR